MHRQHRVDGPRGRLLVEQQVGGRQIERGANVVEPGGTTRREVAYHHIQRKISTRALRAGEPVSDVAISKELGISRTPAREAIRQLVSEGLLESVPGRGVVGLTEVCRKSSDGVE